MISDTLLFSSILFYFNLGATRFRSSFPYLHVNEWKHWSVYHVPSATYQKRFNFGMKQIFLGWNVVFKQYFHEHFVEFWWVPNIFAFFYFFALRVLLTYFGKIIASSESVKEKSCFFIFLKPATLLKITFLHDCFKLCKWYQIAQSTTYNCICCGRKTLFLNGEI